MNVNDRMVGFDNNVVKKEKKKERKEDVSWSNIHITNELREGLFVEVLVQHPGQTSARNDKAARSRREERQW